MTQTSAPPAVFAAPAVSGPPSAPHRARVLFVIAVAACLPYIVLKIVWICGGDTGIPADSVLLDPDRKTALRLANGLTVLMDAAVLGLALLLTRPWGRRVPAWLLAFPMWLATGLLAPIMVAFPIQLVAGAGSAGTAESRAFLDPWVFGVVYGGFIVQGLALGGLFVPYARDRWGRLWRGRIGELPDSPLAPARKATAVAAAALALCPLTTQLLWASGSAAGLSEDLAQDRGSDMYVSQGVGALFGLAAVTGLLLLAFRARPGLRLAVPLAMAWTGSGVLTGWGGWMTLASLAVDDAEAGATPVMHLTYSVQMTVGLLILTAGAHFLAERAASSAVSGNGTSSTPRSERSAA
ncbi:hypothetical protein LHJ74_28520 [Streptomyces sp. N2-109]|uniref:LigA protein n=1 Tax=Streptomyces gossypii TaxID=2883101 RepID=A0ABT2K0V3_9ACTN|nr:hypothetical protein [Streptomyces gossypii]MCT2593804.1 hypothetical protein [Streptomyces gossypii]